MSTVFLWVILVYPLTFYISTQKEEFYKAVVFNKHYITKKGSLEMMPKIQTLYIKHLKPFPEVEEFIEESIKHYNLGLIIIEESMKKALEKYSELKPEVKGILIGVRNDLHGDWPQFMYTSIGGINNTFPNSTLTNPLKFCGFDPAWMLTDEKQEVLHNELDKLKVELMAAHSRNNLIICSNMKPLTVGETNIHNKFRCQ
ncbi:2694_t:CDS:2 [Entrophospora sp. SA101]|nr:3465_t:CDS:2 [Entrophospora sp. SA101]CAJ0857312.1 10756_t:CDS:2 [Entrophospora sp. SA101]CAJ0862357.1 2694_t:CDS:2 [Entrophospora sp. SA101]